MQRSVLVALGAMLVTAGCLVGTGGDSGSSETDDGATGDEAEASLEAFETTGVDCEELVVWATVPAENAHAVVPEDYEVVADDSGFTEAWAALKFCPEGTLEGEEIGPRAQGNAGVLIESPDGSDGLHFYMPWWITSRQDEWERLQGQGWMAYHEADLGLELDLVASSGSVAAAIPWSQGGYGMDAQVAQGANPQEYVVTTWHEGDNGTLQMAEVLTLHEHSYGPATISAEGGSPAEELFGTEREGEGLFFRFDGDWTVGPAGT